MTLQSAIDLARITANKLRVDAFINADVTLAKTSSGYQHRVDYRVGMSLNLTTVGTIHPDGRFVPVVERRAR